MKIILFQYNSCYCLSKRICVWHMQVVISIQLLLLFIPDHMDHYSNRCIFQYNSCYCLSNVFMPFLVFIIVSFPDEINVSLIFSQPIV